MKTLYLVTGAAGYLGGEVCRQIVSRGLQGRALVLPGEKTAKYIPKEIEQYEGDSCDVASLERSFRRSRAWRSSFSTAQAAPLPSASAETALNALLDALDNL